jgi:chitodextrinase
MKNILKFPLLCIVFFMFNISTPTYSKGTNMVQATKEVIPAWNSASSYSRGSLVTYMNKVYRAAYITQGDTPRGFGLAPDGPWVDEGYAI